MPSIDLAFRLTGSAVPVDQEFLAAAKRQLAQLGISGQAYLCTRRTLRVRDQQIVGFEMGVTQLTAEESLTLQEQGLGGRRKMGCGVFVPWGERSE